MLSQVWDAITGKWNNLRGTEGVMHTLEQGAGPGGRFAEDRVAVREELSPGTSVSTKGADVSLLASPQVGDFLDEIVFHVTTAPAAAVAVQVKDGNGGARTVIQLPASAPVGTYRARCKWVAENITANATTSVLGWHLLVTNDASLVYSAYGLMQRAGTL